LIQEDKKARESSATEYGRLRISLIKLGLLLVCVSFCLFLILLNSAAWWLLLVLVLPINLVSEWLGEKVFASKYGWSSEQVGFSPKRIAFGVLLVLGVSVGFYIVLKLLK
jgi:hypothetical protein